MRETEKKLIREIELLLQQSLQSESSEREQSKELP